MQKYVAALFIGRFQPFHKGHLFSLNECFKLAERVIVGVGSSQESGTPSNPWNFEARKKMIETLGLPVEVVAVPDLFNDKKWGEQILVILKKAGYTVDQVVAVGNNDWTNKILREIGITVHESGLYKRNELEGIKIRTLIGEGDDRWRERVPETVVKYLDDRSKYDKN